MMRRQIKLMGWLFVSALAACTSETPNPADGGNAAENVQKLVINLSDGGDRLTTRAGRPLHSSEPGQWVQHVTLYVTNEQGIVLQKEIDEHVWANAVDYSNGKQLEVTFRATEGEQLPAGDYTVYAVAFSKETDYRITPEPNSNPEINAIEDGLIIPSLVQSFDFTNNFSAVLNSGVADAEEIFAGVAKVTAVTVGENNCLVPTKEVQEEETAVYEKKEVPFITLNRQVAGTIGYFTNIPATVNGVAPTKIRLVAANKNNTVNFINMVSRETVTSSGNQAATYVVNGSMTAGGADYTQVGFCNTPDNKGYVVYEIKLEDFFPSAKDHSFAAYDLNGDGFVGYEDIETLKSGNNSSSGGRSSGIVTPDLPDLKPWVNPNNTEEHPQSLVKGSVYGSSFLIPFRWKEMYNTFELQLLGVDAAGDEVFLKAWNVKVSENQLKTDQIPSVSTGVIVTVEGDKSQSCFNVYRNHMYTLGEKDADGDGSRDYDAPNTTDKPEDLSTEIELLITVNTQWKHNETMTIK